MDAAARGLRLVTVLYVALAGALVGALAGLGLRRHLDGHGYRYPDERELPRRDTRWVLVATPLAVALVAVGQVPPRPALGVLLAVAVPLLVGLSAIDLDTRRLPDRWVLPGCAAALVGLAVVCLVERSAAALLAGVLGGVVLGAFYLVNVVVGEVVGSGGGMGLGDAKFGVLLGLLLGPLSWAHVVVATVVAFLAAGVQALVLVARRRAGRGSSLAFGPHMALGAGVVLATPGAIALVGGGS